MNLAEVSEGRVATIQKILDPSAKAHLERLGIVEGSRVECVQRLRGGPVVIRKAVLELSVGRRIAEQILVSVGADGQ